MKNPPRLTPIESARLLLEMAGPPEVRADFEVVSAEAMADGTLARVVVRHLLHGRKFLLSTMILDGQAGFRFDRLP
jgi:hypothetical protein